MRPDDPSSSGLDDPGALLDHSVDSCVVMDSAGIVHAASPSLRFAFAIEPDALVGSSVVDLIHPEDQRAALASLSQTVAAGGRREPLRCRAVDGDGRWRPIEVVANSLDDPPGMVVLSVRDRTGELGFEEMLADRGELYRQIVELIADGVWIIDEESRTTFASEPMAQMLGVTPDEMLGRTIFEFMDADGVAIAEANVERRRQGVTEAHPFKLRHREGHAVWTQMRTGPIATAGPYVGSVAVVTDVTEQVDESRRGDRDRAHLRAMLDALPDLFFQLGDDGTILDVSTTQVAQLFAPPEQLIGRTIHQVMAPGPAALAAAGIRRTLRDGVAQDFDLELELPAGPVQFHVRMASSGSDSVVAIVRDTTELRRAEQTRVEWALERQRREDSERRAELERRLQTAARLDALGRLSGGVAHDVNNLLGVIGNYATVIGRTASDPGLLADVEGIEEAVRHGSELTRRLLRFGRNGASSPASVDAGAVVAGIGAMVSRTARSDVSIRIESDGCPCHVTVDPSQLEQAVVNLIMNAVDASPSGGEVVVRVSCGEDPADPAARTGEVWVTVCDRGPGIPTDLRDRVVEPFFTTKDPGRGTGLGLSVVHGVVEEAGGRLQIEDREGGGARIRLVLPETDAPPAAGPGETSGDAQRCSDEMAVSAPGVVVVDDDPAGLVSLTRVLEAHGIRVHPAGSADEAAAALDSDATLHCVISDVVMPGRSGVELDEQLRSSRPDVHVVLMTGYADSARVDLPADRTVLGKPVAIDDLLAAVAPALTAAG